MEVQSLSISSDFGFSLSCDSLMINRGEVAVLFGESGQGKTTFLYSLTGLLTNQYDAKGTLVLDESQYDLTKLNTFPKELSFAIQGKHVLHPLKKIKHQIFSSSKNKNQESAEYQILELFSIFGFENAEDLLNLYPNQLSGGQKQIFILAVALFEEKEFIILDEPTHGLDAEKIKLVTNFLKSYKNRGSKILIVSHDLKFVNEIGDRFYELSNNKIISKKLGPNPTLLNSKREVITVENILFSLENLKFSHFNRNLFSKGATFTIDSESIYLNKGEIIGFLGVSGSGKSTITNLLTGKYSMQEGKFTKKFNSIQKIFQDSFSSFDALLTLEENLSLFNIRKEKVQEVFKIFGFEVIDLEKKITAFSGGECQKIALARAILLKSEILICDEPFINLDEVQKYEIIQYLINLTITEQIGMVLISHDLEVLNLMSQRIYMFELNNEKKKCNVVLK